MAQRLTAETNSVLGLTGEQFAEWWAAHWQPGEHVAYVGPTGTGKTTAAVTMLKPRRYVLALDPKGGDDTLKKLGYPRLSSWPAGGPRQVWKAVGDEKPARYIVGQVCNRTEDYGSLAVMLKRCVDDTFAAGGFTLYVDELEIAARFMKLAATIELFLIAARNRGISVVTAFQRPAYVPTTASSQTSWFATFYTRDIDVVGRLAEMAGRPKHEMRGMVRGLAAMPYSLLLFSRDPRMPVVVTKPPKVG